MSFYVILRQVSSGYDRLCQVTSGLTGYVRIDLVSSGQFK